MHPLLFSSTKLSFFPLFLVGAHSTLGIDLIDERKNWWLEKKTTKKRKENRLTGVDFYIFFLLFWRKVFKCFLHTLLAQHILVISGQSTKMGA
jgi:hypothetical protein